MSSLPDLSSHPAAARLRVEYRHAPLDALLEDARLLAVFGFGDAAPAAHADPRYLQVALQAQGDVPFECWYGAHQVRSGRDQDIAWSCDGALQFGALECPDDGDIESAAEQAQINSVREYT